MSFATCLFVMAGGAIGTLARYLISNVAAPISGQLPIGTILINIVGSFVIGFFGALTLANGRFAVSENMRVFVMIGICGGFTTFSAFSLQTFDLLRNGATMRAGFNVVASVVLCLCAVSIGQILGARLNGGDHRVAQAEIEEAA
jgi:CrcB protein